MPEPGEEPAAAPPPAAGEPPIADSLRIDMIRVELGYGLLGLAGGEGARLTDQIKGLRRSIATELGFILPAVRIQDNMELGAEEYSVRIKEIAAGNGHLRPTKFLAMGDGATELPGERTQEPAFGLAATWIDAIDKDAAAMRGITVVDASSVLATHLTELVKQNLSELLSFSETQKLIDDLPRENQKLVSELIPAMTSLGSVQRVLQGLLSELVSIRDLPTILEGIQEASGGQVRAIPSIIGHVRTRLARQLSDANIGPAGYIPLITLSPEWETAFIESLVGPAEDRQLAIAPSKLNEFVLRLRAACDAAGNAGESPVLLTSGAIRSHVRAVVERVRPGTPVLAQAEIHPRSRIRTIGSV
jgi:flagellar biosynthesis protein FlhA